MTVIYSSSVYSRSVCSSIVNRFVPVVMMTFIGATTLLSSSAWALNKVAAVNITVSIFAAPPCVINSNSTINVDFGDDLLTSRIDGVNYMKPISYNLDCTTAASNTLKMSIKGDGAALDASYLQTSNNGLGIKLMRSGQALPLNSTFNFTYPTIPVLQAVPIKQTSAALATGLFTASATMVVEYQ
ncbi:fimbrial protein [Yersinia aleksiciae]|uniref:Exported pilin protein n=2 Tax=Yersinia aleksiciae TaxID=263819 RepID=A0A0T9TTJ9_YERAE|nr:exported pilin protein [Yersinia aleksiciae]CNL00767.1 exported pilin protein [Yersinia aleksiciae]